MHPLTRPVWAGAPLVLCCLLSSFVYYESRIAILNQPPQRQMRRRRLKARRPPLDEATRQKYWFVIGKPKKKKEAKGVAFEKSYLGGLFPPVDKDMLPLYLRDTLDVPGAQVLNLNDPSGQAVARKSDLVYFWHIPKASGSTMKNILNFCFDLKRAEQVKAKPSMEMARSNILNVDTSSPEGLAFAFSHQIGNSNKVDVIVSNYFLSGSALFTDIHRGRTFTILRHPIDLALSLFHYRRVASHERSFRKDWQNLSFHDYVSSDSYMDSWMVRQLTGTMPWVRLDNSHLERAKTIMKRKLFVGIMSEMDETIRQLKAHFGWEEKTPKCSYEYLHSKAPTNKNEHPQLQGGRAGKTWNVLAAKEKWDMSLYQYALELFAKQRERYPPKLE
ncbi:hypothetical protein ACHAXT_010590 [Thalassiosira profunda]